MRIEVVNIGDDFPRSQAPRMASEPSDSPPPVKPIPERTPRSRVRANGGGTGTGGGGDVPNRSELRRLLTALRALRAGDFSVRLPDSLDPLFGELAETVNDIAARQERLVAELARVAVTVGREGQPSDRVGLGEVGGGWMLMVSSTNALINSVMEAIGVVTDTLEARARGEALAPQSLQKAQESAAGVFLRLQTAVSGLVNDSIVSGSRTSEVAGSSEHGTAPRTGAIDHEVAEKGTYRDSVVALAEGDDVVRTHRTDAMEHGIIAHIRKTLLQFVSSSTTIPLFTASLIVAAVEVGQRGTASRLPEFVLIAALVPSTIWIATAVVKLLRRRFSSQSRLSDDLAAAYSAAVCEFSRRMKPSS